MNRNLLILLLGIGVGVGSHVAYFRMHQPPDPGTIDGELAWMKTELKLSDTQFARIKMLHEASSPRLRELAVQVAQMQAEFTAFEKTRRATDRVDFVEFAQFVEVRRNISRQCLASTRELVQASADVMTPWQREHYMGIVGPVKSPTDPSRY
jgi:hypothetical protein